MAVLTQATKLIPAVAALGIEPRIAIEQGEIDAAVYLLDQAGAGFGYRYEWERYGPFSETLGADLVELTDEDLQQAGKPDTAALEAVHRVRPLVDPPGASLRPFTWIRLLAALDFLQRYVGRAMTSGGRPAYIESNFEQPAIDAAIERLEGFTP